MSADSTIAVIGMGCVYPGALSAETLWENILAGRRYFRITPDERLPKKYYYDPDPKKPNMTYCDRMAVIDGWSFDPTKWKIPPITFDQSEIVHWLALHTADQALKDANVDFSKTDKHRVGVVLGNSGGGEFHRSYLMPNRWPYIERSIRRAVDNTLTDQDTDNIVSAIRHYYLSPFPEIREDYLAGVMGNVIAGRIANYYDFRAAAYIVDGACASSLLAIIHACEHIKSGDMDIALCGGVDVSLDPLEMVGFAKTQALTRDDIRPYDEQASGIQLGEGCGLLVLASEQHARRHGYPIRALIKGWGISADGSGGITQPKVEGQRCAIEKAYVKAGYNLSSVAYIEGHGTGTSVGDRVEITALKDLLDAANSTNPCHIGSIKANIGHTKAASGVAGMIKTVFALERKILPPHINCRTPNPAFGRPLANLRPCSGGPWESAGPRRAGVSGFGFGGTNIHITLEEADHQDRPREAELQLLGSQQKSELLCLAAASPAKLQQKVARLAAIAGRICQAELTDLAAALAKQPNSARYRAAIVSETPWQLAAQLTRLAAGLANGEALDALDDPQAGLFLAEAREQPRLALLFPGQGSQRLNMGRQFVERFPALRELFQQFDEQMVQASGQPLQPRLYRDLWAADEPTRQGWEEALRDTRLQQPATVACSLAGLRLLGLLGLNPSFAIGHSLGEISALTAGGALQATDAFELAIIRAKAMHGITAKEDGGMAAIGTAADSLQELLDQQGLRLVISNFNSPRQQVVSGPLQEVERLLAICAKRAIWSRRLPVSHAFHSAALTSAAEALRPELTQIPMTKLHRAAVYSTSTACRLPADTDLRELLTQQVVRPVRFVEAVRALAAEQPDLWVEVGPGGVLSGLTRDILGSDRVECFPMDLAQEDGLHLLNRLAARAFVLGFPLRTERLFEGRFHRPFDPETYRPQLIVNPCERPVQPLAEPLSLAGRGLAAQLIPAEVDEDSFQRYLAERGEFLKQYVNLDYQNWPGRSTQRQPVPVPAEPAPPAAQETDPPVEERPIQEIVIDWIVERTGYPREFVTPDKRLRDDLNLDSIKAGELALMLSRQLDRELPVDLGMVANASIEYLVNSVLEFQGQRISMDQSLAGDWVKLFGVQPLPTPIEQEPVRELPPDGVLYLITQDAPDARSTALASALSLAGLDVCQLTLQQAQQEPPPQNLAGLILLLQEAQKPFYQLTADAFKERTEGLAGALFQLLHRLLPTILQREDFRLLVLRPRSLEDAGSEIDGAAALLKTLSLEHAGPGYNWKWLSLPGHWTTDALAACAVRELRHFGERIEYHYDAAGERLSPTAVQQHDNPQRAPRLGGADTLLVSGGGKGITFELAYALAIKTGIKLGLLGSSPAPQLDTEQSELAANLRRLKGKGIRHLYVQADVTRADAVAQAVRQIERRLGRVSVILHGAGVSRFAGFREMALQDYLRCLDIKTTGLYNLLAAVPPARLKALHVISSVLGRTGMHRQADYTYANAWLDGATQCVLRNHPGLHGFSLGYSVWEEIGIGAKSGNMQVLKQIGVTPISTRQGVEAYLQLATTHAPGGTFVYTGRLNETLETRLMPRGQLPQWRFLEKVRRFVPQVELIAEATLSHSTDRYLPEHVFAGTPLMPTVMALEAMVQAAMACLGTTELPLLQQIDLKRPLIVTEADGAVVRIRALCDTTPEGLIRVVVRMGSDGDGFAQDHFEIHCLFGAPTPAVETVPALPPLPQQDYPRELEAFTPSPLFQGRFLRRIQRILALRPFEESLTEMAAPVGARYYADEFEQQTRTLSPAICDSMLQAAGLMAPAGYLPQAITEIRNFRPLQEGERLFCWARGTEQDANSLTTDILLYDSAGSPVQWIKGLVVKATSTVIDLHPKPRTRPLTPERIQQSLQRVLGDSPLSLALAHDSDLLRKAALSLLPLHERASVLQDVAAPRQTPKLVGLLAARKSAIHYFRHSRPGELAPQQIGIGHADDGRPQLLLDGSQALAHPNLSLADSLGVSGAVIGTTPVGIDLEVIEPRDSETWLALLGEDGYALALRMQRETGESFDSSATRVWTLIEAGKKANHLQRRIPRFSTILDDCWVALEGPGEADGRMLSALIDTSEHRFVLSLAFQDGVTATEEQQHG